MVFWAWNGKLVFGLGCGGKLVSWTGEWGRIGAVLGGRRSAPLLSVGWEEELDLDPRLFLPLVLRALEKSPIALCELLSIPENRVPYYLCKCKYPVFD